MKKMIIGFLFCFPITLIAQNIDRTKAPAPAKAPLIQVGNPVKFTLANGLQVFVVKNKKQPMVSAILALDIDGFFDGEKAGLSSMAGQLLKRGTTTKSKAKLDEEVEYLGGSMSTSSTSASVSSLKNNFPKLMNLLSDVVLHPAFSSEELEKVRKQTLSGIESGKDDPNTISNNVMNKLVYGADHPYGEMTTAKTVNKVDVSDVKNFYNTYWKPNIAYLVFVGDIEPAVAKKMAEDNFGKWAKGVVAKTKFPKPVLPAQTYVAIVDRPASVQSVVAVASTVDLAPGGASVIPASVMNNILGGGFSGRLFANLREKHGFTYGAYSSLIPNKEIGIFSAESSVRNEKTDSAVQEILNEIQKLRTEKVGEEELGRMKNYLSGGFARSLENPATIAGFAYNVARYKLPADYYQKYLTNLAAVNAQNVQDAASILLNPAKMHIVIVGNAKQIAKGLDKYGPVKYFDMEGNEIAAPKEAKLDANLKPETLIEKVVMAAGGKEAIGAIKDIQLKGKASIVGSPQSLQVSQTVLIPNNFISSMNMGGMMIMKQSKIDGVYTSIQGGTAAPITAELKEELDEAALFMPEQTYIEKGYQIKIIGAEKVEDHDAIDVEVKTPSGKISHRYYDAKNFLLLKVSNRVEVPGGASFTQQQFFKEYKMINGVQMPTQALIDFGQFKMNLNYDDIKINQGLKLADLK